jgi:hypothetical protein
MLNVDVIAKTNFHADIAITTGSIVLTADCNGKIFRYEGAANITVTVPATLVKGFNCGFAMWGTGTITLTPASGATNRSSKTALNTQYQSGTVLVMKNVGGANAEYLVGGDFA